MCAARKSSVAVVEPPTQPTATAPTPGFWDVDDATYYADVEHVSNSMLSTFLEWRPSYFAKYVEPHLPAADGGEVSPDDVPEEEEEDEKSALKMGTALHVCVLEPDRRDELIAVMPKFNRRSNAGKAEAAEWLTANAGKTILTQKEWAKVDAMHAGVLRSKPATALLAKSGIREKPFRWIDGGTKLWCKGKEDVLTDDEIILDLKSTKDVRRESWMRSVDAFGYHRQVAMYLDGLAAIGRPALNFVHIVVRNCEPFNCVCYELEPPAIQRGRSEYRFLLEQLKECLASGDWTDPTERGVEPVDFPAWMYR